ncbi:MAG: DUF1815 family protein [Cyanobacteriota bacterium]|nr:DUF1815 family protein [Cyanobacteriota bacterium]
MFARLAEQYRSVVHDLVLSLQALARCLQDQGQVASCYVCGDGTHQSGVSFVADLGDSHVVRFLVSDFGITWVESRHGLELLKLEGADAIHELHRVAQQLQTKQVVAGLTPPARSGDLPEPLEVVS